MNELQKPLFSFGVVADIQYADKDDAYHENRNQRYREALVKLQAAVNGFMEKKEELSFVLTLGDIIDGRETDEQMMEDLDKVLNILQPLEQEVPIYHVLGNHCLWLPRDYMLQKLNLKNGYYTVDISQNWRMVALDSTDMSIQKGNAQDWSGKHEAEEYMQNHSDLTQYPNSVPWGGGLSKAQISWFQNVLEESSTEKKNLLIAVHHPLAGCPPSYPMWNYEDILQIIQKYPNVHCVFSGHYHPGAYAYQEKKHFVASEAILECPENNVAFGVVRVYEDQINIEGEGIMVSRQMKI